MKEPFRTNNRVLAFCLALAGCQFDEPQDESPEEKKKDGPAINEYTLGFLRQPHVKKHFREGENMASAIRTLFDKRIPGNVTYVFVNNETTRRAVAAFDAIHAEFSTAGEAGRAPRIPDIPVETVVQVAFVSAVSEKGFDALPFVNPMRTLASTVTSTAHDEPIQDRGGAKPVPRNRREGSGKVWSVFGSKALKHHLQVS